MYFKDRYSAGLKMAKKLAKYKGQDGIILALTDGSVIVAEAIKDKLSFPVAMLLSEDIELPRENSVIGTVNQDGGFVYNNMFSAGQIEEFVSEFHNFIEEEKLRKTHEMNALIGSGGFVDRDKLKNKLIILLSDGVKNGTSFDAAMDFLKPVKYKKLIACAVIASVSAVDKMHIIADELMVLAVTDNFLDTNHYFDDNRLPNKKMIMDKLDGHEAKVQTEVAFKPKRTYN